MNLPKFLTSVENFISGVNRSEEFVSVTQPSSLNGADPAPDSIAPYMEHTFEGTGAYEALQSLDSLPYGAFELDKGGAILRYNDSEAEIMGRTPHECLGLNFFTEIAPCTQKPEFLGRFLEGVRSGHLDHLFQFRFTYRNDGVNVWVCMKKAPRTNSYWIFIKRII